MAIMAGTVTAIMAGNIWLRVWGTCEQAKNNRQSTYLHVLATSDSEVRLHKYVDPG